jgi:AmiR/NasT family two-component response regulator
MLRTMNFRHYIIALTGNSLDDELEEFSIAGADIVLTKPLKMALLDTLLDFFGQQGFNSAVRNVLIFTFVFFFISLK